MTRFWLAGLAAAVLLAVAPARAAPVRTDNVEAELVSARAAVAPGETFTVALRQKIREGWHTYWINPGDSGEPTALTWRELGGFAPGALQWPAPEAIPVGPLTNYGYAGEVLFPISVTAPENASLGPATLAAHARWLVCADICIPEEANLTLTVDLASTGREDSNWAGPIAAAAAAVPKPAGVTARFARAGDGFAFEASGGPLAAGAIRNPYFFPFAGDAIDHAGAQNPAVRAGAVRLVLTPSVAGGVERENLAGVLTFEAREGGSWVRRAVEVEAVPGALPPAAGSGSGAELGVGLAIAFAFFGGLILNVMPCVFPVLSIKALSLARSAHVGEARRHGLLFLAGVMATFLGLASALIALQAAGAAVGWGFQLQEPLVVGALALLFFAIALNLIGAYEVGGGVQNVGAGLAASGGDAGAFFTGALAVLAATPCTAPFMGAALGYAATQPAAVSLAIFAALALGFAAPFTALSLIPALRNLLPKPGSWMGRFKEVLAFPMFAAAVWLVWVLAQQAGAGGVLAALSAFLAFAFAVWFWRAFRSPSRRWAALAAAALVIGFAGWGLRATPVEASRRAAAPLDGEVWSPAREAALRGEGRAVFVNFTAAWCVTCQVNEHVAFTAPEVKRAFAEGKIAYLQADWTNRDPVIAAALAAHGRAGVPLYVLYSAENAAAPTILPQILTPGVVLDAIKKAGAAPVKEADHG